MIRKLFRILLKIVGGVVALAVGAYAVLLVINRNDQPASDIALEYAALIENRPAVADEDNAHFYIENSFSSGIQREPSSTELAADLAEDCRQAQEYCLDMVAQQRYGAELWLTEQQWILDRYLELLGHPEFRESMPDTAMDVTAYGDVGYGQRLLMMSAMLSALSGDQPHVVALLEADIKFWRMAISHSDLLITKMIAAAYVRNHFVFGNRVLRELHTTHRTHTLPRGWLLEINDQEKSLQRALTGEWRFIGNQYDRFASHQTYPVHLYSSRFELILTKVGGWILVPLFQPQDTKNMLAANFEEVITQFDKSYRELPNLVANLTTYGPDRPTPYSRGYNITGDVLFPTFSFDSNYFSRMTDLEGIRRAAVVTSLMREQQTPLDAIADNLATSPYNDPYTDAPFEWDAETQEVLFDGLSEDPHQVYHFRY